MVSNKKSHSKNTGKTCTVLLAALMLCGSMVQTAGAAPGLKIVNTAAPGNVGTEVVTESTGRIVQTFNEDAALKANSADGTLQLTMQAAIELAMQNSPDIKSAALDKENAELSRSTQQQAYAQSLVDGVKGSTYAVDANMYTIKVKDAQEKAAENTYELTKETVRVGVEQLYWNIMLKKDAIEADKIALEYAEQQYKSMQIRQNVGMMTSTAVSQYKMAVESALATLTKDEGALKTAIDSLKKQIGASVDAELVLVDDVPMITPIKIDNIESYADKMVAKAPTMQIYDDNIEASEYGEKAQRLSLLSSIMTGVTYSQADMERQYEISTENVKLKKNTAARTLRDTVRSLYYDAITMEANYDTVVQAMTTAAEALRIKQQMFEIGMATQLEVLEAQKNCVSAETQYRQVLIGHAIDALKLEHPWC